MAGSSGGERSAKRLIINIDDFGMCDSTVRAAKEVLDIGNARSTTVMLPCPWAPAAIAAVDRAADVEREFKSQIEAARKLGLRPSHLDGHARP